MLVAKSGVGFSPPYSPEHFLLLPARLKSQVQVGRTHGIHVEKGSVGFSPLHSPEHFLLLPARRKLVDLQPDGVLGAACLLHCRLVRKASRSAPSSVYQG